MSADLIIWREYRTEVVARMRRPSSLVRNPAAAIVAAHASGSLRREAHTALAEADARRALLGVLDGYGR